MTAEKKVSKRELEIAEISSIMRTESGRNTMYRILNVTGLEFDTFDQDAMKHAYSAGKRSIGLWLRDELMNAAPGEYLQMIKENTNVPRTSSDSSGDD